MRQLVYIIAAVMISVVLSYLVNQIKPMSPTLRRTALPVLLVIFVLLAIVVSNHTSRQSGPHVYHEISMTEICQRQYGNAAHNQPDHFRDMNDPNSWYCVDDAGAEIGSVDIQKYYCDLRFPGSKATNIDGTAYGWRCEE